MIKNLNSLKNYNLNKIIRFYTSTSNGSTATSTQSFLLNKKKVNENLTFKTLDNNVLPLSLSRFAIDSDNFSLYENEHKAILIKSIKNGCNVIKSTNESKLLSNVLSDLLDNDEIKRSELVYIKKTSPLKTTLPTTTTNNSILLEQLSINSINNQISKALQDTQFDTIDIFLLDLNNIMKLYNSNNSNNSDIYKLLENQIFPHLEYLVLNGTIQSYGISSNDFSNNNESILSIEKLINLKNQNSDKFKHFLFIEYPFNFYQNHAIVNKIYNSKNSNNSSKINLYEYLKENNITTINNSPNQFINYNNNNNNSNSSSGEIGRFEMVPNHDKQDIPQQLKEAFNIAIHLETNNPIFKDSILQQTLLSNKSLIGSLQWGHNLVYESSRNQLLSNLWLWKPILMTKINPTVQEAILSVFGNHVINTWGGNYRKAITQLFDIYTKSLELQLFENQSQMNTLINSLISNQDDELKLKLSEITNSKMAFEKLSMLQKSTIFSSIGSDILLESPNSINNLKSLQSDIKLPDLVNTQDNELLLSQFLLLSKYLIKLINDQKNSNNLSNKE